MSRFYLGTNESEVHNLQLEENRNKEYAIDYLKTTKVASLRKKKTKNGIVMVLHKNDTWRDAFIRYHDIYNRSSLDLLAKELRYQKITLSEDYIGYKFSTEKEEIYTDLDSYTVSGDTISRNYSHDGTITHYYAEEVTKTVHYDVYVKTVKNEKIIGKEKEFIKDHDYYFANGNLPSLAVVWFKILLAFLLGMCFFASSITALLFSNSIGFISEGFFLTDLIKKIPNIYSILTTNPVLWTSVFGLGSIFFLIMSFIYLPSIKGMKGVLDWYVILLKVAAYFVGITYGLLLVGKLLYATGIFESPLFEFLLVIEQVGAYVGELACMLFFAGGIVLCLLGMLTGGYGANGRIKDNLREYIKKVEDFVANGGIKRMRELRHEIVMNSSYYSFYVE